MFVPKNGTGHSDCKQSITTAVATLSIRVRHRLPIFLCPGASPLARPYLLDISGSLAIFAAMRRWSGGEQL